jgi:hypothetical protein
MHAQQGKHYTYPFGWKLHLDRKGVNTQYTYQQMEKMFNCIAMGPCREKCKLKSVLLLLAHK